MTAIGMFVTLFANTRTIAVVGLSSRPERPSHEVARYLQTQGYRIVPVNPAYAGTVILNEVCHPDLAHAARALATEGVTIDIVDCFRKSEAMMPVTEQAIAIGARCLWMQLGVVNVAAQTLAMAAGLTVVMDHCIKIDHMRSTGNV